MSLYLNKTAPATAWLSPAIKVFKRPPLVNQHHATPLLDVAAANPPAQYLQAVAGNAGQTQQTGVKVQLWALAFGTATAPSLYLGSVGGTGGRVVPPGPNGLTIDAGLEVDFTQPWDASHGLTSTQQEIIDHFAGGEVHCCIYANVVGAGDPGSRAIANPSDPAAQFDPAGNPRHAQRNMIVKGINTPDEMDAKMFMANPDEEEGEQTVELVQTNPMRLRPWEIAELVELGPWIRRHKEFPLGIAIDVGGDLQPLGISKEPLETIELAVEGEGAVGTGKALTAGLKGFEPRRMQLRADLGGKDFTLRVFDVVQRGRDGKVVGGARITSLTAPQELLERKFRPVRRATAA